MSAEAEDITTKTHDFGSRRGSVRMNDQRSLYEQLLSVLQLANENGHYDAADWIMAQGIKPIQDRMVRSTDGYKVKHG